MNLSFNSARSSGRAGVPLNSSTSLLTERPFFRCTVTILAPANFTGIKFGLVTVGTAPSITASGGRLSGQLTGFTAQWNKLSFKQGATVTGTYNAQTHAYVLTWSSRISGGPFNGFTGIWHLQGTYQA